MPIIDQIHYDSFYNNPDTYLIKNKPSYENVLESIESITNELKSDELTRINQIVGLDKNALVINGGSPLNQLTENLQKDINTFVEELNDNFENAFRYEIRNHKASEANETLIKVQQKYDEYLEKIELAVTNYNNNRFHNYDKVNEMYTTVYPEASFTKDNTKAPIIYYRYDKGNIEAPISVLQPINDAEKEGESFYIKYVEPAIVLVEKYGSFSEIPPTVDMLSSIENVDEIFKNPYDSSSKSDNEKEETDNE